MAKKRNGKKPVTSRNAQTPRHGPGRKTQTAVATGTEAEWRDDHYVTAYSLARDGLSELEIAEAIGVTLATLRKWRRERKPLREALDRGREHSLEKEQAIAVKVDGLNRQQRRFVWQYLEDMDGPAAALRAGYRGPSAKSTAQNLLKKPEIQDAIAREHSRRQRRIEITQDRVLREIALVAMFNPLEMFASDGSLLNPAEMPEHVARALAQMKLTRSETKGREEGESTTELKAEVKTWDKLKALEMLGKHLGLFEDKIKLNASLDIGLLNSLLDMREDNVIDAEAVAVEAIEAGEPEGGA